MDCSYSAFCGLSCGGSVVAHFRIVPCSGNVYSSTEQYSTISHSIV